MTSADPASRSSTYGIVLAALLSINYGIVFFDRNSLNFLMPFIQPELGLSGTQIGIIASVLSLSWATAAYSLARAADYYGQHKIFLVIATVVFSLMCVATGLAGGFITLLAARLLMGAAEGGVLPISLSMISAAVSGRARGLAMGVTQNLGSSLIGNFLAPIVLVPFAHHYGWRHAFVLCAIPGLITALFIWKYARPMAQVQQQQKVKQEQTSLGDALKFATAMRQRNLVLCGIIAILAVSFFLITMVFMPLYLVQVRHFKPESMAWLLAVLGIASTINSVILPAIADRMGRKPVMILGAILGILLPIGALIPTLDSLSVAVLFALGWSPVALFPLFMGAIPAETVRPHQAATAIGIVMGLGEAIGGVLSPAITGMLTDAFGLQIALVMLIVLALVIFALSLFLIETAPRLKDAAVTAY